MQDSALMRPGRLDRILYVGPPNQAGREEILRIRTKTMKIEPGVDFEQLGVMVCGIFFFSNPFNEISTDGRLFGG